MTTDRPPIQEIAKRVGEAGAGLVAVAKAISVDDFATAQEDYRQRVRDDHALGTQLLGAEPKLTVPKESEEMRRVIMVTGDVYGDKAAETLNRIANNPPQPQGTQAKEPVTTLAKAALAAALLAGGGGAGLGIPWLMGMFDKPAIEQPAEQPQEQTPQNAYGLSL